MKGKIGLGVIIDVPGSKMQLYYTAAVLLRAGGIRRSRTNEVGSSRKDYTHLAPARDRCWGACSSPAEIRPRKNFSTDVTWE